MITAVLWSALTAGTLLIGMALAYCNLINHKWTGLIMAFGAGALISAAAYSLVLKAFVEIEGKFILIGMGLVAGALTFYFADRWIDHMGGEDRKDFDGAQAGGSGIGILLGSLLDGVPESLVLGLSLYHYSQVSVTFIFAVAMSNIPEGLGGTTGMLTGGWSKSKITRLWLAVCGVSILAAALGYGFAQIFPGLSGEVVDAFAAGAMLVMLTDAMIPESFEHGGKETGLCLVLGFSVAVAIGLMSIK
jgi:zinc transporter, ZIP family